MISVSKKGQSGLAPAVVERVRNILTFLQEMEDVQEIRLEFSKGTLPRVDTRLPNSSGSFGLLGWFLTGCTLAHLSHFRHFYRESPPLTEIMVCIIMCIQIQRRSSCGPGQSQPYFRKRPLAGVQQACASKKEESDNQQTSQKRNRKHHAAKRANGFCLRI